MLSTEVLFTEIKEMSKLFLLFLHTEVHTLFWLFIQLNVDIHYLAKFFSSVFRKSYLVLEASNSSQISCIQT